MKNLKKYIGLCGVAMLSVAAQAQTIATFETEDYKQLGVYDTWVGSPFRTGDLEGNVAVLDNHLKDSESNGTSKILGVQRSRFGSNTFGVRIDLKETFELTPTAKYVHVMIHKPTEGRVMLIGLGKRQDRPEQSAEVEQFWAYPANDVKVGEWFDAVFSIKGNGGIDIHSLVLVPDCEAPHGMTEDFVAYVDEIEITNNIKPRFGLGYYPVNYAMEADWGRSDRKINGVKLQSSSGAQTISIPSSELKGYNKRFETVFKAKAGESVTPSFVYEGTWMHGFVYLDRGNDGEFSAAVDGSNNLDRSTDLVAYSYYKADGTSYGKNSAGTTIYEWNSGNNVLNPPGFTVPSDLTPGIYRMRYKVDWNDIDPGGSVKAGNHILDNGGGVVDVLLNVHGDEVTVNQDNRNGAVLLASTGEPIDNEVVPFGQPLKIKMQPSNGFEYNGIRVRHGYNLSGDSLIKDNPQFRDTYYLVDQFAADNTFTIPGDCIDGDVLIEGLFVEAGNAAKARKIVYNITFNGQVLDTQEFSVLSGEPYPQASIETETSPEFYVLAGIPEGVVPTEAEDPREEIVITLTLEQNTPFKASVDHTNAAWYTMTLTAEKVPVVHNPSYTYISLYSTSVSATDHNAQWAFVGNVIEGFKIINRGAGEGKILSSSTNTESNTGGSTYPIMTDEPVPSTHNTFWIPTKSTDISGSNGFYLHQKGIAANKMNSRDNRLAYWTGGAGAGSTFIVTLVEDNLQGIEDIIGDQNNGPVEFYNLQGIKVASDNLTPGIYIMRQGDKASKVLVQ